MNEEEGTFEIRGFHDFTIVRDSAGCVDVRYKGESVQGVTDIKVRAFSQEEDFPVLVLEIMPNEWNKEYSKQFKTKLKEFTDRYMKDKEEMTKLRTED